MRASGISAADSGGRLPFGRVERDRIVERVVAAARAAQCGEMCSRAQTFAEVVRERADVEAGGAVDGEGDAAAVDAQHLETVDSDLCPRRSDRSSWFDRLTTSEVPSRSS